MHRILWHADFHVGSRRVLNPKGRWQRAHLLGILDDYSRLCCHAQWYLAEDAQRFAHGLSQALQKRGLPRALLTDNGGAETAAEITEGLARLGIVQETTLPYSAYQNAKQEVFWAQVEGRLLAMLEGVEPLTLGPLNEATLAWVEREYHRTRPRRTRLHATAALSAPAPMWGESAPDADNLQARSSAPNTTRVQRRSDGTCSRARRAALRCQRAIRHLQRLSTCATRAGTSRASNSLDPHTEQCVHHALSARQGTRNAERGRRALRDGEASPKPLKPMSETTTACRCTAARSTHGRVRRHRLAARLSALSTYEDDRYR